jgi:hypothetical protein
MQTSEAPPIAIYRYSAQQSWPTEREASPVLRPVITCATRTVGLQCFVPDPSITMTSDGSVGGEESVRAYG